MDAERQQNQVAELREAMREDVAMLRTIIHGEREEKANVSNDIPRWMNWSFWFAILAMLFVFIYMFVTTNGMAKICPAAFIFFSVRSLYAYFPRR